MGEREKGERTHIHTAVWGNHSTAAAAAAVVVVEFLRTNPRPINVSDSEKNTYKIYPAGNNELCIRGVRVQYAVSSLYLYTPNTNICSHARTHSFVLFIHLKTEVIEWKKTAFDRLVHIVLLSLSSLVITSLLFSLAHMPSNRKNKIDLYWVLTI